VPEVWFAIPGDLATLTGGYGYARRILESLPSVGWSPHYVKLPSGFPHPSELELTATREMLSRVPPGSCLLVDGLAFGATPKDLIQSFDLTYIALVHHPLADESGLSEAEIQKLKASEKAALSLAHAVVATSPHTANALCRNYGVEKQNLFVAQPGTDPAPRATPRNERPKFLTVGTLTYRKGHDVLVAALSTLKDLAWHSLIVGSLDRDPVVAAHILSLINHHDLEDRFTLRGELKESDLGAEYATADIFVLPSRHEGYGMVFAESLARGLPIVACRTGAVVDTVPQNAGLLVPPNDPSALANALRLLISDHTLRQKMAEAAWVAGRTLPTWKDAAKHIAQALEHASS